MKVMLNTNFYVDGVSDHGYLELEAGATLMDLLQALSKRCQDDSKFIIPETNQVDPDEYSIHVNQTALDYLPRGLETVLNDGDLVSVIYWMDVLGGG